LRRASVNVVVDAPQGVPNTIPSIWEATNPALIVVRLHGRNYGTWNRRGLKSSSQRFDYDNNEEELREIAGNLRQIARKAKTTHVLDRCDGVSERRGYMRARARPPSASLGNQCAKGTRGGGELAKGHLPPPRGEMTAGAETCDSPPSTHGQETAIPALPSPPGMVAKEVVVAAPKTQDVEV
jgi:hypothetical protein